MRLIINIPASHKELLEDLDECPPRGRAERLRALAMVGLLSLRGERVERRESKPDPQPEAAPRKSEDTEVTRSRRALKDSLIGSF
jgi:hypothetical protein